MDTLQINGLSVSTKIGVYPWEQRINQQLLIDISLESDFSDCQDDINRTIDYAALCDQVTHFVESGSFKLIETVAHEIAHLIQKNFTIKSLIVSVSKPHAIKNAGNIRITVRRNE